MSVADMKQPSETNWARFEQRGEETIDVSDLPELSDEQFAAGRLVLPGGKSAILVTIDTELRNWLDSLGDERHDVLDDALREYRERHARAS